MATAREEILARIADALGGEEREVPPAPVHRPVVASSAKRDDAALLESLTTRIADYGATIERVSRQTVGPAIGLICRHHGVRRLAIPADLPDEWRPPRVELVVDEPPLAFQDLERVDGVLTGCAWAAAETGTIALSHGSGQGRRALSLLPDLHICVVDSGQVVPDIPDLIDLLCDTPRERRPITLISGPSATSDIEFQRVEGVHGPRRLAVVLVC